MVKTTLQRTIAVTSSTLLTSATLLGLGAAPASAEPGVSFTFHENQNGGYNHAKWLGGVNKNKKAGEARWFADPIPPSLPNGDTLCASDELSDGYYISAHLNTGRSVHTNGHPAPYAKRKGGNLPENKIYKIKVCIRHAASGWSTCSPWRSVLS
ncbi:hypothetical protein ACWFR5_21285 [Streptomyces sp. NPDC055092]